MSAVLAAFGTEAALLRAVDRLRDAGVSDVETFSPLPVQQESLDEWTSWLPAIVLGSGIAGAGFMFGLETLSTVSSWGYPIDIGGRPAFSWPAYIPIAVAFGILCAALGGLVAYAVASAVWRLWDPVDEFDAMRRASRDRWVVQVHVEGKARLHVVRRVLDEVDPLSVRALPHDLEEVPA